MVSLAGEPVPLSGSDAGLTATGVVSAGVTATSAGTGALWGGNKSRDAVPPAKAAARTPAAGNRGSHHDLAGTTDEDGRFGRSVWAGSGTSVMDSIDNLASSASGTCGVLATCDRLDGGGSVSPVSHRAPVGRCAAKRSLRNP
ncbi:MAG: hypothetical protein ACRDS0_32870 [Pseudonocardiaceae bacterium]